MEDEELIFKVAMSIILILFFAGIGLGLTVNQNWLALSAAAMVGNFIAMLWIL